MSEFTPGPLDIHLGRNHFTIEDSRERELATVWADSEISIVEARANANLVSAAPDMYEALERALQFITNGMELGYIRMPDADSGDAALETPNIIRKALARARGESHE